MFDIFMSKMASDLYEMEKEALSPDLLGRLARGPAGVKPGVRAGQALTGGFKKPPLPASGGTPGGGGMLGMIKSKFGR